MTLRTKIKFYSSIALVGTILVACGKAKVDGVKGTAVVTRSNGSAPKVSPDSPAGDTPTARPPLPSDQELEEMIDIVQDTNTEEIANQVPDEDENPIPPEIFIPEITEEKSEPKAPTAPPVVVPVKPKTEDKTEIKTPPPVVPPKKPSQTATPAPVPAPAPAPAPEPKKQTPAEQSGQPDKAEPKGPKDQAVNFPDNGRLQKGASLLSRRTALGKNSPFEFSKRTVDQQRYFATDDLVNFIEFMGNFFQSLQPGHKLLISDLSVQGGGPVCCSSKKSNSGKQMLSHQSHQNGLDADIAYLTNEEKDKFFAISSATVRKSVNLNAQLELFKQAFKLKVVDFILIHPSLKKELCIEAYKQGALDPETKEIETVEALRLLIPDQSHNDHFHVRIKCDPKVHPKCQSRKHAQLSHGCVVKQKPVSK